MCVGIPMQVIKPGFFSAQCLDGERLVEIDTSLVGQVEEGQWLMVFLGAAREIISEEMARQSLDALKALKHVMQGERNIDHLFADLIEGDSNRQPVASSATSLPQKD